jgi:hypothetical protein
MQVSATWCIELSDDERLLLRDTIDAAIPHLERIMEKVASDPNLSVNAEECDGRQMGSHLVSRVCGNGVDLLRAIFSSLDA